MSEMIGKHLTEHSFAEGAEAYVRYCSGLAVVQFPEEMADMHRFEDIEDAAPEIIGIAHKIMLDGVKRIIKVSHPDNVTNIQDAEDGFDKAEPAMREILEFSAERHQARLDYLSELYAVIRPAPFLRPTTYRAVCHRKNLPTASLLDGLTPDVRLIDALVPARVTKNDN